MMIAFVKRRYRVRFVTLAFIAAMLLGAGWARAEVASQPQKPKYIFLFIGDGMGLAHRMAAEYCLSYKAGESVPQPNQMRLVMNRLPVQSPMTTSSTDKFQTDSGASGTAIACGEKTKNKNLGVLPDLRPMTSIAKVAHEKGYRVGILTSVSLDHATPAAFYACIKSRYEYDCIPQQLVDSPFEYFAGGGLLGNTKRDSKTEDFYEQMKKRGVSVVRSLEALQSCKPGQKVYATSPLLSKRGEALHWALETPKGAITLAQFTEQGIRLLDNPGGFFMMVEGGRIDWAGHANDAGSVVADTIAMDDAVKVAYDFFKKHPHETLILVTADHETGGLTLGNKDIKPGILCGQPYSVDTLREKIKKVEGEGAPFENVLPIVTEFYGDSKNLSKKDEKQLEETWEAILAVKNATNSGERQQTRKENKLRFGQSSPDFAAECVRLRDQASGIHFTHHSHTSIPVITSVAGVGQELFVGFHDNTDIAKKIGRLLGVELPIIAESAKTK